MIRLNLSTRPFYNEGLVRLALAVVSVALLWGLTLGGRDVVRLTAARSALSARVAAAEQGVSVAVANTRSLEAKARQADLDDLRRSAAEANEVIGARVFSWTALLNDVVEHLPAGVRLVAVQPERAGDDTRVGMIVRARSNADIEQFLTRLEATGRFRRGLVNDGELDDDGTLRVTLTIDYATGARLDSVEEGSRQGATP